MKKFYSKNAMNLKKNLLVIDKFLSKFISKINEILLNTKYEILDIFYIFLKQQKKLNF